MKNMNFFRSIQFIVLFECFLFIEILCEKTRHSLLLTIKDNKVEYVKPIKNQNAYQVMEFRAPKEGKTYHFCPSLDNEEAVQQEIKILIPTEFVEPNELTNDANRCEHSNRPFLLKVRNPQVLKKNWNGNEAIELYHYTYMLNINSIAMRPEYDAWPSNYNPLLGIEIFYDLLIEQTRAVSYELLSVSIDDWLPYPLAQYESVETLKDLEFMEFIKEDNDVKFLERKLNKEVSKYIQGRTENLFVLSPFAPSPHFPTGLSGIASLVQLNLFPMWKKTYESWKKVEQFIKRVASSVGDLRVTAGIIGIMGLKISDPQLEDASSPESSNTDHLLEEEENENEEETVLLEDDEFNLVIPKYTWKAIEFNDYGILVVMHLNPFAPTPEKICEKDVGETNGWTVSNSDFSTGEIYFCDMTAENIRKLEANFLSLTEKKPFMLKTNSENQFILNETR